MPVAAADQSLYAIVSATPPANVGEVIAVMQQIEALLPNTDGLKWFNRLYLEVTRAVDLQPVTAWQDPCRAAATGCDLRELLPARAGGVF